MPKNKAIVAICCNHAQTEKAIAALQRIGFDMKHVSVCGKAHVSDEEIIGCYVAGGGLRAHGGSAAFWERLWSLLGEGGLFHVPAIGSLAVAGFFVGTLASTPKDAAAIGSLTESEGAIHNIGRPTDSDYMYQKELRANKCVLIAFGTREAADGARTEIENAHAAESVVSHE